MTLYVYLAARYERKWEMRKVRERITSRHVTVVSRWIDQEDQDEGLGADVLTEAPERGIGYAVKDLEDIQHANLVIVFTGGGNGRGGYHTEVGYALGLGRRLMLVGPRENVFHCLEQVTRYETTDQIVKIMKAYDVIMSNEESGA